MCLKRDLFLKKRLIAEILEMGLEMRRKKAISILVVDLIGEIANANVI